MWSTHEISWTRRQAEHFGYRLKSETDDAILETFLEGGEFGVDEIKAAIRKATIADVLSTVAFIQHRHSNAVQQPNRRRGSTATEDITSVLPAPARSRADGAAGLGQRHRPSAP